MSEGTVFPVRQHNCEPRHLRSAEGPIQTGTKEKKDLDVLFYFSQGSSLPFDLCHPNCLRMQVSPRTRCKQP